MPENKNSKKTATKPSKAIKASPKPVAKAAPAKIVAKAPVKAVPGKKPVTASKPAPTKIAASIKAPAPASKAPIKAAAKPAIIVGKPITSPTVSKDINEKVQILVSLSKTNGYVTVQNINEVIPGSATDPELIENIMNILDNLDIKLLDDDEV